jgi:segregation and condensation protein B
MSDPKDLDAVESVSPAPEPEPEAEPASASEPENGTRSEAEPETGLGLGRVHGSEAGAAEDVSALSDAEAPDVLDASPDSVRGDPVAVRGEPVEPRTDRATPSVSADELAALQAAEEAKDGDPELEEVESAAIDLAEEKEEEAEPFEKLAAAARRLSPDRVRTVVETLLFLAERPLAPEELRAATGIEVARLEKALDTLSGNYREGVCGIVLHEVAGGWQLRSSPDNADFARRFLRVKPQRLTRAALETLAIIAYRQPVTRPEIEEIRGVDCGAVVKALLERRLIKILGKKEEPGRPILYGTTREFLEFFSLKDLASLPTLREFHELSQEHRKIVEKAPEPEPEAGIAGLVADLSDDSVRAELEAKRAEGDAALDELEKAMEQAEASARAASDALGDKKKKDEDGEPPSEVNA